MKSILAIIGLVSVLFTVSAQAVTIERSVPCSSHGMDLPAGVEVARSTQTPIRDAVTGQSLAEYAARACSQLDAINHGKEVCEGDDSTLRGNRPVMTFVKSTIGVTTCKAIDADYTCDTAVVVECK